MKRILVAVFIATFFTCCYPLESILIDDNTSKTDTITIVVDSIKVDTVYCNQHHPKHCWR